MQLAKKIKKSFALQIVVYLFLFSMVIFVLMFLLTSYLSHKIMMKDAEKKAENLAWESIYRIEKILSNIENSTSSLAYLVANNIIKQSELDGFIANQNKINKSILSVTVAYNQDETNDLNPKLSVTYAFSEGKYRKQLLNNQITQYKLDDWYIIPYTKETGYWSEPWINLPLNTEPITSYSFPMFDQNRVIGVVRTDISLRLMQNIVSSIHILKSGYATLISNNGTYITHPADSLILNYTIFSRAEQINFPKLKEIGQDIITGNSKFIKVQFPTNINPLWIYYAPISMNKWSIAVVFKDKEIMGELKRVNMIFSLVLAVGLLILLFSIYFRTTSIFRPLNLLISAIQKVGSGDFNVKLPEIKSENEVSLLTNSFSKMQSELKTYTEHLIQTTREKDKIASEVQFAAEIQQNIIPSDVNFLTDVKEISIFGILEPAEIIGGDLYDAFMIDDRRLCFVIADVFGKGIVASMLMTMVQTLIRSQSLYTVSAVSLIKAINSYLCENNKQANFVTMIVGILDLQTGIVDYCNAGHTPIYLRKANRQCVRNSETQCTALGIFHDLKIESASLQLDAQDFIILFTDGVTEAMSENEVFFGYQRLEDIICSMQNPTSEGLVKAILQDVRSFTKRENQSDDLSILVLKFNHPRVI